VVCDLIPSVPVIVRFITYCGVEFVVVIVRVDVPVPPAVNTIGLGLKVAVVLAGTPLTLRLIVPL
jgi:hypothetical protein